MRSGNLKRPITIQYDAGSTNTANELIPNWQTFIETRAAVIPLNGKQLMEAQKIESEITTRIIIRYRTGINQNMRVLHGSQKFEIMFIVNVNSENRELHLMCKEKVK